MERHLQTDAARLRDHEGVHGHSQGGITAASIAARRPEELTIRSVVTGGSPIGRFDIPDDVSVMSLEHSQDVIPKVDGVDNPDRASWTTVTRGLDADDGAATFENAHATSQYVVTGSLVDGSVEDSIAAWRRDNAAFFATGQQLTAEDYAISRVAP